MMLPFLSQTVFNEQRTIKYRFILYPTDCWIELIKQGKFPEYIADCIDYITKYCEVWYTLRIRRSRHDKFLFFDNKNNYVTYDEFPRFFIDEKILTESEKYETFLGYFLKPKKLEMEDLEILKYSKDEVLDILKKDE